MGVLLDVIKSKLRANLQLSNRWERGSVMKRLSQTLRILFALIIATFGTSVVPTGAVYAMDSEETPAIEEQIETTLVDAPGDPGEGEVVPPTDDPIEETDTTTTAAPKEDNQEQVVDSDDTNDDIVQVLLSPNTLERQSAAAVQVDTVKKVVFCHATPPEDAKNGWNRLDTAVEVVFNAGHDSEHAKDIIPPFYYEKQGQTLYFAGLNWDEAGQAIFDNNCVDATQPPVVDYCNPANRPSGMSIAQWVPENIDCVDFSTATECGVVRASLMNLTTYSTYAVSWSEGSPNWNTNTSLTEKTFPEDYNGGSVEVYMWLTGPEADYVTGRDIPNFWEKTYTKVLVDTDCKETPVTPAAPYVKDLCYDDRDGIFVVSNTKGVKYYVDGNKVHGWKWVPFTGTPIEVTAEARKGYEIPEGTVAEWTYSSASFTDEQCLTITKSAKVASDINLDGIINVGDTVTWTITVTNTSDEDYEAFKVVIEDPNAVLEGNGFIKLLGAGKSKTLTATSTITTNDLEACKVVNTANFSGWRYGFVHHGENNNDVSRMTAPEREGRWTMPEALTTGSATATYNLYCPEPEQPGGQVLGTQTPAPQVLATSTTLPEVLPATGASAQETNYTLIGIILSAAVYYFALRRQTAQA